MAESGPAFTRPCWIRGVPLPPMQDRDEYVYTDCGPQAKGFPYGTKRAVGTVIVVTRAMPRSFEGAEG